MVSTITASDFQQAAGTRDWRVLGSAASAWFGADGHAGGAALLTRIAELALAMSAPMPDVDIRTGGVRVGFSAADRQLRPADVELASAISGAAADLGLRADPAALQELQLTFDVRDQEPVARFWESALGYQRFGDEDLVDPDRRCPPIWFQHQDAPRPLRNRLHLDVARPQEASRTTVDTVPALAGTVLGEHGYHALVADAEGNEADVLPIGPGQDSWGEQRSDWRTIFAAVACYRTGSPAQAAAFAAEAAALADRADLPLLIDVRPGAVFLDTGKDRWEEEPGYSGLAADLQQAARAGGLEPDPQRSRFVQIGIDAADIAGIRAFWQAALGYVADPRDQVTDIIDPRGLGPVLFFQDLDTTDQARVAQRNRIHLDLFVPDDQAAARVDAAVAAGGRIVSDSFAPFGWTIADPEGNELDIAVIVGRAEALRQ